MASRDLAIILKLKDQASPQMKQIRGSIKGMEDQIKSAGKKMTVFGVALAGGIGLAVKEAARAEGSFAKFNTVFGEGSDEMLSFIDNLRTEMPLARSEIVRLAADTQDLLVPLGLTREKAQEMSAGFLDVSNKIAAFNDVNPEEVLNAIKSGLTGSAEPLKRFGVNANIAALEARALKMGLLDAGQGFKDLTPEVKSQIQAQALLAQITENSSDAIEGFAENNDSFIRRQQNLQATLKETAETIGKALLPVIDDIVKAITPVIKKIAQWIDKNPDLAKKIGLVVAGVAALMLVLGPLLIILPGLVTAFTLLNLPILAVIAGIAALIAVVVWLSSHWDEIKAKTVEIWTSISDFFTGIIQTISGAISTGFNAIKNVIVTILEGIKIFLQFWVALIAGLFVMLMDAIFPQWRDMWNKMKETFVIVWEELKLFITESLTAISELWTSIWQGIVDFFTPIWEAITTTLKGGFDKMIGFFRVFKDKGTQIWKAFWDGAKNIGAIAVEGIKALVKSAFNFIIDKINGMIRRINEVKNKAGKLGAAVPNIPEIPRLAKGGIVTGPTIAQVGEAGPEAVIPLDRLKDFGVGSGGASVFNLTINGDVTGEEVVDKVSEGIMNLLRDNEKINFAQ